MIYVSRNKVVVADSVADYYVKNEVYLLLIQSKEAREALLESLERESIIVDRLGVETLEGRYEQKKIPIDLPNMEERRELGVYHKV